MLGLFPALAAALACVTPAASGPTTASDRPPNVLFIAIDDLNDWVGCLGGHPQVKTPNIDALARRGTVFTNAHCQAPLCNPSRTSLLTGLRPSTTGVYGLLPGLRSVAALKDRRTLPQAFAERGYSTFCSGKIFHDGAIDWDHRHDEFQTWEERGPMPFPAKKLVETPEPNRALDWGVFPETDDSQADRKIADAAIARLGALPADKPFFVAAGFRLPHVPCFASQKWFDLYPEETLELPPVKDDDRDDVPPFAWYLHWKLPEPRLSWLRKAHQWRNLVRSYLATVSYMDSEVGRLLDALKASGKQDETLVVLWSDHGWHLGEKGVTGKNTLWERSTRVPLVFAGPGVAAGARCAEAVELLDLYPTFIDLVGLPPIEGLEGHSLVPQLKDANAPRAWPAITTSNQGNHAVRAKDWRYIRYADGSEELYDHRDDPNEWTNLAKSPAHAATLRELARWLPTQNAPAVPGSALRLLTRENGVWTWEGKPIVADQLER
ncbi:sulfatase [Paludisphaera borealis]|uniref:Choline-sulfatase n=1 Tax=Paludisphaera borealis TaxID=1387353 RepID=A0A1U7CU26_9BACT|nr:sulfatase [Paludisphaera borealis]APW62435.1 Choline-sulfatase [Paludisphaera borealis]